MSSYVVFEEQLTMLPTIQVRRSDGTRLGLIFVPLDQEPFFESDGHTVFTPSELETIAHKLRHGV